MRATANERERELEAAIAQREREISALIEQKDSLQSQLVVTTPALRNDPLLSGFPVLDYCGKKPKRQLQSVPVEQVGNVLEQFIIAKKAIDEQNRLDKVEVSDLRRRIRESEATSRTLIRRRQKVADESGINPRNVAAKARDELMSLQTYESEASIDELEARRKVVNLEIKTAMRVRAKKGTTIAVLAEMVAGRTQLIDCIDDLYNQIRVADRDIAVEKEAIEELTGEVFVVEQFLAEKAETGRSASWELIEQDVVNLKLQKENIISGQRVPQQRAEKAQEYRIEQLEKRLKAVDLALKNNRLTRDVERIVSANWSLADNAIEGAASKEELYDTDRILAVDEGVHPGLYNLFLTEKDRLARIISITNIIAKEKEEVIDSLSRKIDTLVHECNAVTQELDEFASGAALAEEAERNQALEWVQSQRIYCDELFAQKQALQAANVVK